MKGVMPILVLLSLPACGGDSAPSAPTAPTPPTVNSLTINGSQTILTWVLSNYTAIATLSDGTTQNVMPTWTVSDANVAYVDDQATGRVIGRNHGSITLEASYQGRTASKAVNVVTNYQGTWTGSYAIRACDQSGVFGDVEWCRELGGVGAVLPVSLKLTHFGENLSQVRGPIQLGEDLGGNLAGNVAGDGRLVLGGSFTFLETESGVTFRFEFGGWDTRLIAPDQMRGRWAQNLTAFGVAGNAYMENELIAMTKTSPTAATGALRSKYSLTWQELFSRMR